MVTQPKSIATVVVVLVGPDARVVHADPGAWSSRPRWSAARSRRSHPPWWSCPPRTHRRPGSSPGSAVRPGYRPAGRPRVGRRPVRRRCGRRRARPPDRRPGARRHAVTGGGAVRRRAPPSGATGHSGDRTESMNHSQDEVGVDERRRCRSTCTSRCPAARRSPTRIRVTPRCSRARAEISATEIGSAQSATIACSSGASRAPGGPAQPPSGRGRSPGSPARSPGRRPPPDRR